MSSDMMIKIKEGFIFMNLYTTINQFIVDNYTYFSRKQAVLDKHIRERKNISDVDWYESAFYDKAHHIALKNEVNEFINECRDIWKYWKDKPVDRELLVDEFVDIIHFATLIFNKKPIVRNAIISNDLTSLENDIKTHVNEQNIIKTYDNLNQLDALACLDTMERTSDITRIIINGLLVMIGYYGFTPNDIVRAYDKKNQVNFDRQNNGW